MGQLINITRQWQVYLPEEIRKEIGLKKPSKAKISAQKDKIIIKPLKSQILSLAGTLSGKRPIQKIKIEKVRDYIDYSQW